MNPIVLAYAGGRASSIAVSWLADAHAADVVAVTVDVGQGGDLGTLRGRAIACGAVRAHVIDARDELAREVLARSPGGFPLAGGCPPIDELPRPVIARKLIEIARIEGARAIAHGSLDTWLEDGLHAIDPTMSVLAPARDWSMSAAQLADYAAARGMPGQIAEAAYRIDQNLWGRTVSWADGDGPPAAARFAGSASLTGPAHIVIHFEQGVPVSINGVAMSPTELVESLTLIAGHHGVGRVEAGGDGRRVVYDAPAVVMLHAALAAVGDGGGSVRFSLLNGRHAVLAPHDFDAEMVTHA